jgi:hypothetical protein
MFQLPNSTSYTPMAGYASPMSSQAHASAAPTDMPSPYALPSAGSYSPSTYGDFGNGSHSPMFGFMKNLMEKFFQRNSGDTAQGYDRFWNNRPGRGFFPRSPRGEHIPSYAGPTAPGELPKAPGETPKTPYGTPKAPGHGPIKPGEGPVAPGENVPENMRDIATNYRSLTTDQRVELSKLTPEELGLLHAGGRGLSFTGSREGIYMSYWTTLDNLRDGKKVSERDKAAVLEAKAMDEKNNLPSGTSFERNYLSTLDKLTGTKEFTKALNGAEVVKDTGKRLQTPDNLNPASKEFIEFQKQQGNTNANYGNMMVITQWNHDLLHELASMQKGTSLVEGRDSEQFLNALLEHEMVDGKFNNSNGEFFLQAFNSAYNKGVKPVELADIEAATKSQSAEAGITLEKVRQVAKSTVNNFLQGGMEGFSKGIQDHAKAMVEKPGSVAANAGNMALAAVCPYVAGLGSVVKNANATQKA